MKLWNQRNCHKFNFLWLISSIQFPLYLHLGPPHSQLLNLHVGVKTLHFVATRRLICLGGGSKAEKIQWKHASYDAMFRFQFLNLSIIVKKSRNGDTLGPVELIVWPEQGNQGDWREHDGQGEVSIIIFGMSKSSGFQKYSICGNNVIYQQD